MLPTDKVRLDFRFHANELPRISPRASRWQVIAAFLKTAEGRAERLIEDTFGVLMLVSIPSQPQSGAVYLYHEPTNSFYWLQIGNREDDFNGREFDEAVATLHLERYVSERVLHHSRARFYRRNRKFTAQAKPVFTPTGNGLGVTAPAHPASSSPPAASSVASTPALSQNVMQ